MKKKLYRTIEDRKIAGVCSGIAKYFNIDSTIVRLIFVICIFVPFVPAVLLYIIGIVVIPSENDINPDELNGPKKAKVKEKK